MHVTERQIEDTGTNVLNNNQFIKIEHTLVGALEFTEKKAF